VVAISKKEEGRGERRQWAEGVPFDIFVFREKSLSLPHYRQVEAWLKRGNRTAERGKEAQVEEH
jgi:hypothetical protein